jgi:hypothetical protein
MDAISQKLDQDFRERLLAHLRSLEDDGRQAFEIAHADLVDSAIADCLRFGLVREVDIARYLETARGQPWFCRGVTAPVPALQILLTFGIAPEDKLRQFEQWGLQGQQAPAL